MSRTDKPIKEDSPYYPSHFVEVDPKEDIVGMTLDKAREIINNAERPLEVLGLYMMYKILYQERKHIPSTKTLRKELNLGRDKIKTLRNIMKECELIEDILLKDKKTGRIVATVTKLRGTYFPAAGKHGGNIIINNNIDTPAFDKQKAGVCPSCSKVNGEVKTPNKKSPPREKDFNTLWSQHPRKVNKQEALRAWSSQPIQKTLPPVDALLDAHAQDAKANDWGNTDKKYIPHLSTWLRGKRWENYTGDLSTPNGLHILEQIRRSDNVDEKALLSEFKPLIGIPRARAYIKWLKAGRGVPTASKKQSIAHVLPPKGEYWKVFNKEGA